MRRRITISASVATALLAGCSGPWAEQLAQPSEGLLPPVLNPVTRINEKLRLLPPPNQRVAVAVYAYVDQTGQFKPSETVQQMSRAVTQGATSVLIKALQDAGNGSWFMVVEREKLDNLLKERRIIADMRNVYLGERQVNPSALPPLCSRASCWRAASSASTATPARAAPARAISASAATSNTARTRSRSICG